MSKRKCVFSNFKKKYPFLRITYNDSNVRCDKYNATFSVAAGGGNDIENHLKIKKHKVAANASLQTSIISDFFIGEKPDLNLSTMEGVWAYHTIQIFSNFFLQITRLMKKCSFTPYALVCHKSDWQTARFICLSTDASNRKAIKMFPVIRYFLPLSGVNVKINELSNKQIAITKLHNKIQNCYLVFRITLGRDICSLKLFFKWVGPGP